MNDKLETPILRQLENQFGLTEWMGLPISDGNMELIREFDDECVVNGLAPASRLHYAKELRAAAALLDKPFRDATKGDLKRTVASFADGRSTKTVNNLKIAVKRFYKWLYDMDDEYPKVVKWMKPKTVKNKIKPEQLITDDEFGKLLRACNNQRDRTMLQLIREEAFRPHELLGMRVGDVRPTKYGFLITVDGKTGSRTVPVIDAAPDLRLWLNIHAAREDAEAPLWHAFKRGDLSPLGYDGFRNVFRRLSRVSGIKRRVFPYLFRHTALTADAKKLPESVLRKKAGWVPGSRMPAVYVHLSGRDVEDAVLRERGMEPEGEPEFAREPASCPRCGQDNPYDAKYCMGCSAPMDPATPYQEEEADVQKRIGDLEETVKNLTMLLNRQGLTPLEAARIDPSTKEAEG